MQVNKVVNISLSEEDMSTLDRGEALQVPLDEEKGIVIHPPREEKHGE